MVANSKISYRALTSCFMIRSTSPTGKLEYICCLSRLFLAPRSVRHFLFRFETDHCHKQWLLHKGYSHRGRPSSSRERERDDTLIHRMSTAFAVAKGKCGGKLDILMKATSCTTPVCFVTTTWPSGFLCFVERSTSTISLRTPLLYGYWVSVDQ